jgi:hypothetical protein
LREGLDRAKRAAGLKLALGAMPVQDEGGRCGIGEKHGDFIGNIPNALNLSDRSADSLVREFV